MCGGLGQKNTLRKSSYECVVNATICWLIPPKSVKTMALSKHCLFEDSD